MNICYRCNKLEFWTYSSEKQAYPKQPSLVTHLESFFVYLKKEPGPTVKISPHLAIDMLRARRALLTQVIATCT